MTSSNGNIVHVTVLFVRGIHRWPVNSPHKGQWRGALIFSLICAWTNNWANDGDTCDLRHHRAYYDVNLIISLKCGNFAVIEYTAIRTPYSIFQNQDLPSSLGAVSFHIIFAFFGWSCLVLLWVLGDFHQFIIFQWIWIFISHFAHTWYSIRSLFKPIITGDTYSGRHEWECFMPYMTKQDETRHDNALHRHMKFLDFSNKPSTGL